jgi:hypothetical protein
MSLHEDIPLMPGDLLSPVNASSPYMDGFGQDQVEFIVSIIKETSSYNYRGEECYWVTIVVCTGGTLLKRRCNFKSMVYTDHQERRLS